MSPQVSFTEDLKKLLALPGPKIQKIIILLNVTDPDIGKVKKQIPAYFLRLLQVYLSAQKNDEIMKLVSKQAPGLINWFNTNIKDVDTMPGIKAVLEQGKDALGDISIDPELRMKLSREIGTINGYHDKKFLTGRELSPYIQVFFMNRGECLLSSQGDWDDWMFLVSCLLNSLAEQADDLKTSREPWENLPWEKLFKFVSKSNQALNDFEKQLISHAPKEYKPRAPFKRSQKKVVSSKLPSNKNAG